MLADLLVILKSITFTWKHRRPAGSPDWPGCSDVGPQVPSPLRTQFLGWRTGAVDTRAESHRFPAGFDRSTTGRSRERSSGLERTGLLTMVKIICSTRSAIAVFTFAYEEEYYRIEWLAGESQLECRVYPPKDRNSGGQRLGLPVLPVGTGWTVSNWPKNLNSNLIF